MINVEVVRTQTYKTIGLCRCSEGSLYHLKRVTLLHKDSYLITVWLLNCLFSICEVILEKKTFYTSREKFMYM